ncbi:unnamed protein product [Paramecium octaurelia]|uniref:Uncharacterized protein n=1 Tax=Paramecium octaurelia TaxID=43137 RepID=A0A8S1T920_PAROT|nr:unnamed protein product [Paramecium octaurelia]
MYKAELLPMQHDQKRLSEKYRDYLEYLAIHLEKVLCSQMHLLYKLCIKKMRVYNSRNQYPKRLFRQYHCHQRGKIDVLQILKEDKLLDQKESIHSNKELLQLVLVYWWFISVIRMDKVGAQKYDAYKDIACVYKQILSKLKISQIINQLVDFERLNLYLLLQSLVKITILMILLQQINRILIILVMRSLIVKTFFILLF